MVEELGEVGVEPAAGLLSTMETSVQVAAAVESKMPSLVEQIVCAREATRELENCTVVHTGRRSVGSVTKASPYLSEPQIQWPDWLPSLHGRRQHIVVARGDSYTGVVRGRLGDAEVMVAVGACQVPATVMLVRKYIDRSTTGIIRDRADYIALTDVRAPGVCARMSGGGPGAAATAGFKGRGGRSSFLADATGSDWVRSGAGGRVPGKGGGGLAA